MTPYNQILKLHMEGCNNSQIAEIAGCSRKTVITVMQLVDQYGMQYPFPAPLSDLEIHRLLHPKKTRNKPDMGSMLYELQVSGHSINHIWMRYCEQCEENNETPYSKAQFQNFIADEKKKIHMPDYESAIAIKYVKNAFEDQYGNKHGLLFGETVISHFLTVIDVPDKKLRTWIHALISLCHQLSYVPQKCYITNRLPKNVIGPTHDCLEYYGIEVIEESTIHEVKTVQKVIESISMIDECETTPFVAIQSYQMEHNRQSFIENVNLNRYQALVIEAETERTLPEKDYELVEYAESFPQLNYHIQIEGMYYSVPFEFRHDKIVSYIYDSHIEMFCESSMICVHDKLKGKKGKYSTNPDHIPMEDEIPWDETSGRSLRKWAKKIGPCTLKVVDMLLKRATYEVQAYKTCNTLLHCSTTYSAEALESACKQTVNSKIISYRFITEILKHIKERPET